MSISFRRFYRFLLLRYYDPTSDGFYYENMGSRGWRRRLPVSAQKRLKMEQVWFISVLQLFSFRYV